MTATCLAITLLSACSQSGSVDFHSVLTIGSLGRGGRIPVTTNSLLDTIVNGALPLPAIGTEVVSTTGETKKWKETVVGPDGWFASDDFSGGFAFAAYDAPANRVMMLEAAGHSFVYVNGEPRGGDPYSFGFLRLPVEIKKGANSFLFNVARGRLKFRLVEVESGVFVEARDATLPDLITGEIGERVGAVIVTNATPLTMREFVLRARLASGRYEETRLPDLPPLSFLKVPFSFEQPKSLVGEKARLSISLVDRNRLAQREPVVFELAIVPPTRLHTRTFVSNVDGSAQYYAVQPASTASADALVLSVHGAGVEATSQAAAYGQKSWATLVAPTNRRPYGFDWEDWGRIDAIEALVDAKRVYKPREDRIYLTGHSMGGHGAWYLGATYPDQWGAIGPAAGWINFWSYGGAVAFDNPDPIETMLLRVASPSDPLKFVENYSALGVYVLHGDADDTVPVKQARNMREKLGAFHRDVDFFEQPGGGHWYDSTPEPGADCVDYGPMFEFFDKHRRRLSKDVRSFKFSTVCPQVNATCYWASIHAQTAQFLTSSIVATNPIGTRLFELDTVNVDRLLIDLRRSPLLDVAAPVTVKIDGAELKEIAPNDGRVHLQFENKAWRAVEQFPRAEKSPENGGPFKSAFNNRFLLVYGTTGTAEENAWSYAKARYDAETWWYRGNGFAEVVSDSSFNSKKPIGDNRNAIIYGNEDTNSQAKLMLENSPVHVKRGAIRFIDRTVAGDDVAILMVRPQSSGDSQIAIVGGTGLSGMRATNTMPYFVSGVHYPDMLVFRSSLHREGTKAIEAAGIFGNDWSVEKGDFSWKSSP